MSQPLTPHVINLLVRVRNHLLEMGVAEVEMEVEMELERVAQSSDAQEGGGEGVGVSEREGEEEERPTDESFLLRSSFSTRSRPSMAFESSSQGWCAVATDSRVASAAASDRHRDS